MGRLLGQRQVRGAIFGTVGLSETGTELICGLNAFGNNAKGGNVAVNTAGQARGK